MEIVPGDHSTNSVGVLCRPELADFVGGGGSPRLVSDANLPILVRQIALHADVSEVEGWGSFRHLLHTFGRGFGMNKMNLNWHLILQLASTIWESLNRPPRSPYASNWLERLRKIRKIRQMVNEPEGAQGNIMDFTDMVDADKWDKARGGGSGYWQQFLA